MTTTLTLDQAGRALIPRSVGQELRLAPGDTLRIETTDDEITLRPLRSKALIRKEHGVWVYQGEPSDVSVSSLIDRVRESRVREQLKILLLVE